MISARWRRSRPPSGWPGSSPCRTCSSPRRGHCCCSASLFRWSWLEGAFLLEAITRDALGDRTAAERALERALDLAEPDNTLLWFLQQPAPALLGQHARHRTSHASLITEIDNLLAARNSA